MSVRRVNVPPQKVYADVPIQLPLIRMSQAEASAITGPQIYDRSYPLNYDGLFLDPQWNESPYYMQPIPPAGPGNVKLTAHEMSGMGYFGSLGLTAAQVKAQAAAAARKAAKPAPAPKTPRPAPTPKAVPAPKPVKTIDYTAKQQACLNKNGTWDDNSHLCTPAPKPVKTIDYTAKQQACLNKNGTWDDNSHLCTPAPKPVKTPPAKDYTKQQNACSKKGGAWDSVANLCTPASKPSVTDKKNAADLLKQQKACTKGGGTWDSVNNVCQTAQQICTAGGGYWNGTTCVGASQQQCVTTGGTWDVNTGVCIAKPGTNCPLSQLQCPPGQILSIGPSGCMDTCAPDPNYQSPIQQCQSAGGQWNGTSCMYPQQFQPPPTSSPYGMPPPDYGGGGGGGAPMMPSAPPPDYSGGGASSPMTQSGAGPGPQLNDQASQYADSVQQSDQTTDDSGQTPEEAASTQDDSSATTSDDNSDTAQVAQSGVMDSIKKLLSGGNGLSSGLYAPPAWFNTHLGGNAPPIHYSPVVAKTRPGVKPSTTSGVLLGAGVLIAGAAAIFLWSSGQKKRKTKRNRGF